MPRSLVIARDILGWAAGGGAAGAAIAAGVDLLYFYVVKSDDVLTGLCLGAIVGAAWTAIDWLEKPR